MIKIEFKNLTKSGDRGIYNRGNKITEKNIKNNLTFLKSMLYFSI